MPRTAAEIENELRSAAACRQYQKVSTLAQEYGEAVHAYTQTLPPRDPRIAEAARQLDEPYSWTLMMLHAARVDCAAELQRATTANRYTSSTPGRTSAIHLDL